MNEQVGKKRDWIKNAAIVFLALMLVLTFFSNTIMNHSLPEVSAQYVSSGTIQAKVRGNGTIQAGDPYSVKTEASKTILSVAVNNGDHVERGDVIFYLEEGDSADLEKAQIGQYLPESAWVVANERKLPIFLHLFRRAALSDPDNFLYITTMTHRYPNAQLVLAHCARGFASWTMMKSIKELEDQGNIWFDLSAICETGPMMACILKNAGKRTIWGSDYPCTMCRGRAVSIGNGQNWLLDDNYNGPERALLPAENLMAFYQTALLLNLDQTQINDIFYNNAEFLFYKG